MQSLILGGGGEKRQVFNMLSSAVVSVTAMKAQDHKASCRGKGLFSLYFHIAIHH